MPYQHICPINKSNHHTLLIHQTYQHINTPYQAHYLNNNTFHQYTLSIKSTHLLRTLLCPSGVTIGKLMLLGRYREAVDVILLDDYYDENDDNGGNDNGENVDDGGDGPISTPLQHARRLYRQGASVATVLQVFLLSYLYCNPPPPLSPDDSLNHHDFLIHFQTLLLTQPNPILPYLLPQPLSL